MTAESKSLTITLTGRPPVKIDKAEWRTIAEAKGWDGQIESQATRTRRLVVRQHEDGRAIVYGVTTSQWQGERGARGGELLEAGADLADALYRVAEHVGIDQGLVEHCIAKLPAEDLTAPAVTYECPSCHARTPHVTGLCPTCGYVGRGRETTDPDLSLTPIDVGFDLRRHGMVAIVPAATRSVAYDVVGERRIVTGDLPTIRRALEEAGYTVEVRP